MPWSWKLQGYGLKEMELLGRGVIKVEEMVKKYPKHPGRTDLFALVLAMEEKTILLTGDNALRKAALQEGVEAHGILGAIQCSVKPGSTKPGLNEDTKMFKRLCTTQDVSPGEMKQFDLKEEEILVANLKGQFCCLEGRCSHAGAPLAEGSLKVDILTCLWHYSQFRLPDGSVLRGPARKPLQVYRAEEKDDQLFVETKDSKGCDGVEE